MVDTTPNETDNVPEILRIKGNLFDFETPLCEAYNEFSCLLKIDTDLFTYDIQNFKTYDEYKQELNDDKAKDTEKSWSENGRDGKLKDETLALKAKIEGSRGYATLGVLKFCKWLKSCFENFYEIEYEVLVKLQECWWKVNAYEIAPFTHSESDAEDVYDKTGTFMASNNPKSGSGIGNKILYERWDETLNEDPYDDKEYIADGGGGEFGVVLCESNSVGSKGSIHLLPRFLLLPPQSQDYKSPNSVDGDVEEVGDLSLESMEDEEVATVDGVFEGAFGALGDKTWFGGGSFGGCHGGLWWLIMDEEDDEVISFLAIQFVAQREDHHLVEKKWECRIIGEWTHDPIDDIVNAIIKMRVLFHDVLKKASQEHAIRKIGVARAHSIRLTKKSESGILYFDGAVQLDTVQLKKSRNIIRSRKIVQPRIVQLLYQQIGAIRETRTLRTLPKSRMTKQGNLTQRTPQAKNQSDQASRQISKQASGSANAPYDLVFTAMGPPLGTTQTTATITSTEGLQRATFTTPPQTVPGTNTTEPPPPPLRNKGPELGADNLTLEGVATELAPSDFVSQNYETLVALMQEETKKRSSQSLQARLNFGPEDEVSPPRHQKERRGKDNRRPPVFGRIGKKVSGTQTANLQNLDTHENNDWRISVRDRLGSRDVHSRLGQRRSPSESPPSSDSEDSRRKRRRRVSSSSEDSSDNEDAETGHWKSKNKYREDEDEDMSRPWRRQKVDAFTRRISDFSEDKKRRMPANVKTYDGTGDPDDHLKIFESAATIENWPQPVWCHMFNSTLVGNARNWFSKLPRRSIDGFEELRRAFRLNFTQRKKCAKNPVELARVKQRQGESTSAYVERYKDECIHVKACPEILKISGFMNGINNPELIKRLNDRVPQTFDELMKRTRSFIQGEAAAADSRKGYSNNRSQEQSRRQSNDQSSSRNNSYRGQRGGRGNDKYTPLTMTPKEILATEGANFPRPPPMRTPEEQRVGNGYCEYHRQKGHTTNECVQLRQLIDKLV
ncbi:reverse transcriptase domain-containing protein [Tanacetum coccineum]